jgi:hypothetical protein
MYQFFFLIRFFLVVHGDRPLDSTAIPENIAHDTQSNMERMRQKDRLNQESQKTLTDELLPLLLQLLQLVQNVTLAASLAIAVQPTKIAF